jgi:hypothetical protein
VPVRRPVACVLAAQRLADGVSQADVARTYGVSQATISRLAAPSPFGQARPASRSAGEAEALMRPKMVGLARPMQPL